VTESIKDLLVDFWKKFRQHLHNYLRMNKELFQNVLSLIRPRIEKKETLMTDALSAEERLAVTIFRVRSLPACLPGAWTAVWYRDLLQLQLNPWQLPAHTAICIVIRCCATCIPTCVNMYGALWFLSTSFTLTPTLVNLSSYTAISTFFFVITTTAGKENYPAIYLRRC
jgi:hypothetical protein